MQCFVVVSVYSCCQAAYFHVMCLDSTCSLLLIVSQSLEISDSNDIKTITNKKHIIL